MVPHRTPDRSLFEARISRMEAKERVVEETERENEMRNQIAAIRDAAQSHAKKATESLERKEEIELLMLYKINKTPNDNNEI